MVVPLVVRQILSSALLAFDVPLMVRTTRSPGRRFWNCSVVMFAFCLVGGSGVLWVGGAPLLFGVVYAVEGAASVAALAGYGAPPHEEGGCVVAYAEVAGELGEVAVVLLLECVHAGGVLAEDVEKVSACDGFVQVLDVQDVQHGVGCVVFLFCEGECHGWCVLLDVGSDEFGLAAHALEAGGDFRVVALVLVQHVLHDGFDCGGVVAAGFYGADFVGVHFQDEALLEYGRKPPVFSAVQLALCGTLVLEEVYCDFLLCCGVAHGGGIDAGGVHAVREQLDLGACTFRPKKETWRAPSFSAHRCMHLLSK